MPDTFQLGGYGLVADEPFEPMSGSEVLRRQVQRDRAKQQQDAELRRQAELDQHLQQYNDDPVSKAWGEAEFRLKQNESALTQRKQAEDEIGGQFDDPVAKAWAIASQRLKGTDQPAVREAQADADAMEAMQRKNQMSAALDRVTPDNAFVRETVGGMLNAAPDFVSIAARLTGNGEAADELNRQSQEFGQARGELRETDWSPWLSRQYGGAVQSITQMAGTPGGAYGKIGGAALMSGNQALTTAEDAGLTGTDRLRYAGTQGLLEGGVAAIFQKLGLGGVEARLGGQAVASQTWKQLAKSVGQDALQEIPEEALTAVLQDVSSKLEGVTPDMGFGDFVQNAADAAVQAVMMSGLANTPNATKLAAKKVVEQFVAQPSRKNYEQLPEELKQGPANQAQREALAEKLKQGPQEILTTEPVVKKTEPKFEVEPTVSQPGEEVIPDQGPSVAAPTKTDAVKSEASKWQSIDTYRDYLISVGNTPEQADAKIAAQASVTTPPDGPAATIPNPEQGATDEQEEQRRTGQQGLLTPEPTVPEATPAASLPTGPAQGRETPQTPSEEAQATQTGEMSPAPVSEQGPERYQVAAAGKRPDAGWKVVDVSTGKAIDVRVSRDDAVGVADQLNGKTAAQAPVPVKRKLSDVSREELAKTFDQGPEANEKATAPEASTKVLYPSGDGQQGSVAESTVQPVRPQDKRLAPYIDKLKKDYPPDYFEAEDDGIAYEDRIRAIAERDADEDEANAEEGRRRSMTAEERIREVGGTSDDRRDVAGERFAEYGIEPTAISEGSSYFSVGGMKVRFSDHDPSSQREKEFGASGVDVNTGDTARDSTDYVKDDPDHIRSVVDKIVKKFAPGKFKTRQPTVPAQAPSLSPTATAPQGGQAVPTQGPVVEVGDQSVPEPQDGWESNLIKARKYGSELGLQTQGKPLGQLVNEIQQAIAAPAEVGDQSPHPDGLTTKPETLTTKPGRLVVKDVRTGQETVIPEKPPQPPVAEAPKSSPHVALAKSVAQALSQNANIDQKSLSDFADAAYGGTRAEGKYGPSDAYDALEAGVNQHLAGQTNPAADLTHVEQQAAKLRSLIDGRIPRQGARSGEKDDLQQFSTPPDYGLAVAWLANIKPSDVVLEPSAGTGSLAMQAKNAGATVYTNELSERRREFLDDQGYAKTFGEDAEQIQNILKSKMPSPDVVVMNPPFSRAANRMGDKMVSGTDLKHIDSALSLMKPGGRLVAIVGAGLHGETQTLIKWIGALKDRGLWIRANVPVGRDAYKGYGTSFPTRVLIIDKAPKPEGAFPVTGGVDTITELMRKLEEVRGDRQQTTQPSGKGESKPTEPSGPATPEDAGVRPTRQPNRPSDAPRADAGDARTGGTGGRTGGDAGGAPVEKPARPAETPEGRDGPDRDVADPGTDGSGEPVGGDPEGEGSGRIGRVSRVKKGKKSEEESNFSRYEPELSVPGTKPHPANLVESAAMAAVPLPAVDYKPNLPAKIIADGKLSDAQVEQIVLAGNAHSKTLPNGERGGYMIGDGTGVGKGREISGVILDNFQQGRKKAVWVSINSGLLPSAQRDWAGIGQNKDDIFELPEIGGDMPKTGIVFTTYPTLKSKNRKNETRLDQLANWLGADFDGVIVFDEAHKMANAQDSGQGRSQQRASQQALAGVELQRRLPNARVLYVSATAASDVKNLAYADRLGLWGPGTEFNDKGDFINNISAGGVATMELVAQNMKAMGVYHARAIDYSDVTQSPLEQKLDFEQRAIYDRVADAWQGVFSDVMTAIGMTGRDAKASSYALSAFYSSQQRFFNSLLTAMSLPKVIENMEANIKAGKSVVVQITQTGGASQDRALANMEEGDDYEDVVISPFEQLYGFVDRSFPTQEYETYLDDDGNEQTRPVKDSEGNPVQNQDAVRMKEALLADLGSLERQIPVSPLDQLIEHFGAEAVAEVTGRTERLVHVRNEKGEMERIRQPRSERARLADAKAFMDGKKHILVFSEAGGTGMSYHADRTEKNQEQRVHYLLQAGWSAFSAVQGLGRTHRSNQASAPQYILVSTDLPGHKRFVSTIARRLSQLGALTRGQRQAASNELFSERDNLENKFSQEALEQFLRQVAQNSIEGIGVEQFQKETGLRLIGSDGSLLVSKIKIPQFLNRLLALKVDFQNAVFDGFSGFLDARLDMAKQSGELNQGVEAIKAEKIDKLDDRVVHTDPRTGAEVRYVKLKVWNKTETRSFEKGAGVEKFLGFYQATNSGKIWAVGEASSRTDYQSGRVVPRIRRQGPTGQILDDADKIDNEKHWRKVSKDEARKLWEEQLADVPALTDTERHMLTGALLTVWNKLPSTGVTVQRATLADGSQVLGRVMPADEMAKVASSLGMDAKTAAIDVEDALRRLVDGKVKLKLGNGWKLQPSRVGGSRRIELVGPSFYAKASLQQQGVIVERVAHEDRYFIPNGENQRKVLDKVLERDRIVEVMGVRQEDDDDSDTTHRGRAPASFGDVNPQPWASTEAESGAGKKLLSRLAADSRSDDPSIGLRSVVEFLNELAHTVLLVGRTQTTKRHPAHFTGDAKGRGVYGPAIIRSRFGSSQLNFHEAGHALSNWMRDADPRFFHGLGEQLKDVAKMPGFASAKTAEEGIAEVVRRFVVGETVPADLWSSLEKRLEKDQPEVLAGLRDAHRAYVFHRGRPQEQQMRANAGDQPPKGEMLAGLRNTLYWLAYNTFGGSWAIHRINRKLFKGISGSGWLSGGSGFGEMVRSAVSGKSRSLLALARSVRKELHNKPTDTEAAYQARMHATDEVARLMGGVRGDREGVRVLQLGDSLSQAATADGLEALRLAGFDISDDAANAPYGEYVYLSNQSFAKIKHTIGDKYQSFEVYAQYKAALSRWDAKKLDYPGMHDGLTPTKLRAFVEETEAANPEWQGHFKDVQRLMDQMVLVGVMSGEHTVESAIRIRQSFEDYVPLPRQVEDRAAYLGTVTGGGSPTSGVQRAKGSLLDFRPLEESIEYRVRRSMTAYYENALRVSMLKMTDAINKDDRLPYDVRKSMARLMLPLRMESKRIATMTPMEAQEVVADAMNRMSAEKEGIDVERLSPKELAAMLEIQGLESFRPEDIAISLPGKPIYRQAAPKAIHVVTTFRHGELAYHQVTDPMLFDLFSGTKHLKPYLAWVARFVGKPLLPWRRMLTQNIAFALRNLPRDTITAMQLGEGVSSVIPGYVAGTALLNRLQGDPEGHRAQARSELLSKSLDHTTSDAHGTVWDSFRLMLGEGITDSGWSQLSAVDRAAELPGIAMSALMKPIDVMNWMTGGRWLSEQTESLPREGAFIAAKKRGDTTARAIRSYDRVTGQFIQRQPNAELQAVVRASGFLNPAIQIVGGQLEAMTDPDPAARAAFLMVKLPMLTAWASVGAALNYMMILAMTEDDDEERQRIFKQMKERTEQDRLGTMSLGGVVRLPFDKGLAGAAVSFGWNDTEDWLYGVSPQLGASRATALLTRAADVPVPTDMIHPFWQVSRDLWQNHSEYMDADIVPQFLERKYPNNPELQTLPDVPEAFNAIGRATNSSPLKIRYAMRGVVGSDVVSLIQMLDSGIKSPSDLPVIGRLISRDPQGWSSRSVRSVIDLDDQYVAAMATAEQQPMTPELKVKIDRTRTSHQAMLEVERIWSNAKTKEQKTEAQKEMTRVSSEFLKTGALNGHRINLLWEHALGKGEKKDESTKILKTLRVTPQQKAEALKSLDAEFQKDHDAALKKKGQPSYPFPKYKNGKPNKAYWNRYRAIEAM